MTPTFLRVPPNNMLNNYHSVLDQPQSVTVYCREKCSNSYTLLCLFAFPMIYLINMSGGVVFVRALPVISDEKIPITNLITHHLGLTGIQKVFTGLRGGKELDGKEIVKAVIDLDLEDRR